MCWRNTFIIEVPIHACDTCARVVGHKRVGVGHEVILSHLFVFEHFELSAQTGEYLGRVESGCRLRFNGPVLLEILQRLRRNDDVTVFFEPNVTTAFELFEIIRIGEELQILYAKEPGNIRFIYLVVRRQTDQPGKDKYLGGVQPEEIP